MKYWDKTRNTLLSLIAVSMMTSGCSVIMAANQGGHCSPTFRSRRRDGGGARQSRRVPPAIHS